MDWSCPSVCPSASLSDINILVNLKFAFKFWKLLFSSVLRSLAVTCFYTPCQRKLWRGGGGYTGFIVAVCPSVRLSVEKCFPHDNSISFWHTLYNDDTSHIYCPWLEEDFYWFWGQKGQGLIQTLYFVLSPQDNSITFCPIDFGV